MAIHYKEEKGYILAYTRKAEKKVYPAGLAYSIHFAYSRDGASYQPIHDNYGILFAKALVCENNSLHTKSLKAPWIFTRKEGGYGILAVRTREDGSADEESRGVVLLWTTEDFRTFREWDAFSLGRDVNVERIACKYQADKGCYRICWQESGSAYFYKEVGDIMDASAWEQAAPYVEEDRWLPEMLEESAEKWLENVELGNKQPISRIQGDRALQYWGKLYNVKVQVPEKVKVSRLEELEQVGAVVAYSDGSTAKKAVQWNVDEIDEQKPGTYHLKGEVRNKAYSFPLVKGCGDPVIFQWEGQFYFIGTNDNEHDVKFYVREAEEVEDLFAEGIESHLILDLDVKRGLLQTFWAPEFHVIGGELYILFAVSGTKWGPQCHMMKLKKGGHITEPDSWEDPIRVCRKDGTFLAYSEDAITLDMTFLQTGRGSYLVWSYREHMGSPDDSGSMLYIAEIDEQMPWKLISDPVLLSRPLYGWENLEGTINNEGPYAFLYNGKVWMTYSGGAANSYTYAIGLLTAEEDADLLDPSVWSKRVTPVLSYYSTEGIYGPGHNSFFVDRDGSLYIAYHAETSPDSVLRCDMIHRVHFDIHGEPIFDLAADRDLTPGLEQVEMDVEIISREP